MATSVKKDMIKLINKTFLVFVVHNHLKVLKTEITRIFSVNAHCDFYQDFGKPLRPEFCNPSNLQQHIMGHFIPFLAGFLLLISSLPSPDIKILYFLS